MSNGRVVARGVGDTASGTFMCVVRRMLVDGRVRYHVDVENDSGAAAEVVMTRGAGTLPSFTVPARTRIACSSLLVGAGEPLAIDITCGETLLTLREGAGALDRGVVPALPSGLMLALLGAAMIVGERLFVRRHPRATSAKPVAAEPVPVSPPAHGLAVVDAPPIRVTPMRRPPEPLAIRQPRSHASQLPVLAALLVGGALVAAFVLALPRVGDLGAPNVVLEGSVVDIPYSSSGIGDLRYTVTSSPGATIASEPLAARSGLLHVAIPAGQGRRTYRVGLMMSGPLGEASREATIGIQPLPPPRVVTRIVSRAAAVPTVRSFAVSRGVVAGVPAVFAAYDVSADAGMLRLVDTRGIQYRSTALSPTGQTTLTLPAGTDPGTLIVALRVTRNGAAAETRIALPADETGLGSATTSPPPVPGIDAREAPPIAVANRAVGRTAIYVQITRHYPGLRVALLDENARKIVDLDVPRDASAVSLPHPPVSTPTLMTVEATYRINDEADTVVRAVLLIPAGG